MAKRERNSEVRSYAYINEALKECGWDIRNPSRHPNGQVWTQQECLEDENIRACLKLDRPENVIKVTENALWVIEAKATHAELEKAAKEARDYAKAINKGNPYRALFVSGVAGGAIPLIRTEYLESNGKFRPITINGREPSSLLTPEIARTVLADGPEIKDLVIDERLFLNRAERINEHLHNGAINKSDRARIMAALLLSLVEDPPPNIDANPTVLISEINARAASVLDKHDKSNFAAHVKIDLPTSKDNHFKFREALVRSIQDLNSLNIRSAMNSGKDVLGKFYEVFLKYGNGAKEIGIVLTPRHITQFAVDAIGISNNDVVLDPTCGTGGFLVAAFDAVRKKYSKAKVDEFKTKNLFGVEQDPDVVALALVNMIFRGDGNNGIIEGNCFAKHVARINGNGKMGYQKDAPDKEKDRVVTRVLMNPPFALKRQDEKEYKFVECALSQMIDGGILFAVLPYSSMVKPKKYQAWREDSLIKNNTLLSVVTFPPELFYPVGVHTIGIFVKRGIPHPHEQPVLWLRAISDGLLKSKGKRLPSSKEPNDYIGSLDTVRNFFLNPNAPIPNIPKFQKAAPIDFSDSLFELVPENYLDQDAPSESEMQEGIDQTVRDTLAYLLRFKQL